MPRSFLSRNNEVFANLPSGSGPRPGKSINVKWVESLRKYLTLGVLSLKCVRSEDPAEALNNHIRGQLQQYEKYLSQDDGAHKEDLQKLISLYESALKVENYEEKQKIVKSVTEQFSAEFGAYVQGKLQEDQVSQDIVAAIAFYKGLPNSDAYKADIEKAVAELEGLQKETDFEAKKNGFVNLEKTFSAEFITFLKEDSLPKVNHDLQSAVDFFNKVQASKLEEFASEIETLKAKAEAALADSVSIEEKQKTLFEITNPNNPSLTEFLQKKFVEHN